MSEQTLPQQNETNPSSVLTRDEAVELLSYADVVDEAQAAANKEYVENGSGSKYVGALQEMAQEIGAKRLTEIAKAVHWKTLETLDKLQVDPSTYTKSLSWTFWDMAKQRYLWKHPEESSAEYTSGKNFIKPGDPIAMDPDGLKKRNEIVNRHVGWEIDRAIGSGEMDVTNLNVFPTYHRDIRETIDSADRNETGQLRSYALVQLGRRALRAADIQLPGQQ